MLNQYKHDAATMVPMKNGKQVAVKNDYAEVLKGRHNIAQFTPLSGGSGNFTANKYVDIEIAGGKLDHISTMDLQIAISNPNTFAATANTTYGSLAVIPMTYLIESIHYYIGSTEIYYESSESLDFQFWLFNSLEQIIQRAPGVNYKQPTFGVCTTGDYGKNEALAGVTNANLWGDAGMRVGESTGQVGAFSQAIQFLNWQPVGPLARQLYTTQYAPTSTTGGGAVATDSYTAAASTGAMTATTPPTPLSPATTAISITAGFPSPAAMRTYAFPSVIPAGATQTYNLPLTNIYTQSDIFIPTLRDRPKLRIYFKQDSNIYATARDASTPLGAQLASIQLNCSGLQYDDKVRSQLVQRYKKAPHISRGYQVLQQTQFWGTTPSTGGSIQTSVNINLSGLNGSLAGLIFAVRKSNPSLGPEYTKYVRINDYTLLRSDGTPDGLPNIASEYVLEQIIPSALPGLAPFCSESPIQGKKIYVHPFSLDLAAAYTDGCAAGLEQVDTNWSIQVRLAVGNNVPSTIQVNGTTRSNQDYVFNISAPYETGTIANAATSSVAFPGISRYNDVDVSTAYDVLLMGLRAVQVIQNPDGSVDFAYL
jgi:hypothetical protein